MDILRMITTLLSKHIFSATNNGLIFKEYNTRLFPQLCTKDSKDFLVRIEEKTIWYKLY